MFWRDPSVGLIGAIGQYTTQRSHVDTGGGTIDFGADDYYAGLEGQYFFNNITLYAQAAYDSRTFSSVGSIDGDGFILAGQVRYFAMPDWSIAAKGSYGVIDYDTSAFFGAGSLKNTSWSAGLRSDYRLASMPVNVFAELSYGENKTTGTALFADISEKSTRAMIGFQYSFGSKTLQERDRAGASLDPFETHTAAVTP